MTTEAPAPIPALHFELLCAAWLAQGLDETSTLLGRSALCRKLSWIGCVALEISQPEALLHGPAYHQALFASIRATALSLVGPKAWKQERLWSHMEQEFVAELISDAISAPQLARLSRALREEPPSGSQGASPLEGVALANALARIAPRSAQSQMEGSQSALDRLQAIKHGGRLVNQSLVMARVLTELLARSRPQWIATGEREMLEAQAAALPSGLKGLRL